MNKKYEEFINNYDSDSVKALRIYNKEGNDLVDILTSDGKVHTGLEYNEAGVNILTAFVNEQTIVYDERITKTFDSLARSLKASNKKMYSQFEELCNQNGIDFNTIKEVLDNKQNKTPVEKTECNCKCKNTKEEKGKPFTLELSGTPEQVMSQMEEAIKEHPELKHMIKAYPFIFPYFRF